MVNPIYLLIISLAAGFLLSVFEKGGRKLSLTVFYGVLSFNVFVIADWFYQIVFLGQPTLMINTAGFVAPLSINLQLGVQESFVLLFTNITGLLSAIYLFKKFKESHISSLILYIILIMGVNGLVMTRDLFNMFVFMEIVSISTYALTVLTKTKYSLAAGFKYMIAGGLSSIFLLLGIVFVYYFTGNLNIDFISQSDFNGIGLISIFLVASAVFIELKPFPANGWALDVYQSVNSGIAAVIAVVNSAAILFVFYKIMPIMPERLLNVFGIAGVVTFLFSNLLGLKQTNAKRLLGYSSIGQVGLLVASLIFTMNSPSTLVYLIVGGFFINHLIAKAGLFWIAGIVEKEDIKDWGILRQKPILLVLFGVFLFALTSFPPFPAFFAKWKLIMMLVKDGSYIVSALILLGSFFEGIYLFRWFSYTLKLDNSHLPQLKTKFSQIIAPVIFGIIIFVVGYFSGTCLEETNGLNYIPLVFILFIGLIDFLPAWVKNTISIIGVSIYTYFIFPQFQGDLFRTIFAIIFLGGAILTLISGYYYKGRRAGFHATALMMFAGLSLLVESQNLLQFFYGWELMAMGSYFLLIRGKKSMPHGLSYMLFSIGGSYTMLFGFALAHASSGGVGFDALTGITVLPTLAYSLMIIGFLTKTASVGLHIWLPGAHGEAVADIHFMASAILLKAGVFGLILVLLGMGSEASYTKYILFTLGWLGAISALTANIAAAFQESAKRLLAWSSIGQLGYIVFGLATMTHLGWLAAMSYSITHFLYKGILFLIIGGIALKIGTPYMYKMGGLIKRMPYSFTAVLIAIIALAGIPPLIGFTGKWIFYNVIISEGFIYQGFVIMIAGLVAFLYCFRLIYTIFLGQLKDNLRKVKEINIWFLIPVYTLVSIILYISVFPNTLLKPIGGMLTKYFPNNVINWEGTMGTTELGYFDGAMIMYIVTAIFVVVFLWLVFINRKAKKVKQFDIFYSGEKPSSPELTHYGYNFFAHYRKAIGFLTIPIVINFWDYMTDLVHSTADFIRKIYNGNGQTYAMHIILFVIVLYLISIGG